MESYVESVKQLKFFPKIFYELGHGGGYAVDLFYPSILLLPYAILRIVGMSTGVALAFFYFLLNFITASSSFALGYHLFKKVKPSILVSLIYTLSTYRFHDEIVRGALGEVFGFAFMPIAFIGLYSILFGDKKQWFYLPIGMSLLIISHVLSAYMLFLFVVLFIIYKFFIRKAMKEFIDRMKLIIASGIWTFLIVAWQLLPMLEQTARLDYNYSKTGLNLPMNDLRSTIKTAFLSNISGEVSLTNSIGTFLIIMIFVSWIIFFKLDKYAKTGLIFSSILFVMTSNFFPWRVLQDTPVKMIQFPFRLLLFCTLFFAVLVGYIFLKNFNSRNSIFILLTVVVVGLAIHLNYSFKPEFLNINTLADIAQSQDSFGGGQEYVKKGYTYITVVPKNETDIEMDDDKAVLDLKVERINNQLLVSGNALKKVIVKTPFLYYYGYQVSDDTGKKLMTLEKDGRVAFQFPEGKQVIKVVYKLTLIQMISMILSIVSIVMFIVVIFREKLLNIKMRYL